MELNSFIGIGNNEINELPNITKGDIVLHKHEDGTIEEAVVQFGKTTDGETGEDRESNLICYYKLSNGKLCLAGFKGKMLSNPRFTLKPKE